jgi:hypothetical protein
MCLIVGPTDGPGPLCQPASTCSSPTRPRRSPPRRGERRGGRQTTSLLLHSAAARRADLLRRIRRLPEPYPLPPPRSGRYGHPSPLSVLYLCTRAARGDLDPGFPAVATRDGSSLARGAAGKHLIGSRARAM